MSINSSVGIVKSVGRNGTNETLDVVAVQTRLNELMGGSRTNLVVDGDCGNLTRGMIGDFQVNVVGFKWPDFRVDPAGKTIIALNDPGSASVWQRMSLPIPTPPKPTPSSGGGSKPKTPSKPATRPTAKPRALTPEEVAATKAKGFLRFVDSASPGGVITISAGETWEGPEGKRLIVHAQEWTTLKDGVEQPDG
ncbi:MAG: hypothetical protein AAF615_05645, partial [Pseudomonadota bacterium]